MRGVTPDTIRRFIDSINSVSLAKLCWYVFVAYFAYVVVAAIAVQFFVVPYLLPHLDRGQGILDGIDTYRFHLGAVTNMENVLRDGWGEFRLRPYPYRQPPSGVLSILYLLFGPRFFLVIPLSAFLHAGAGVLLILITYQITGCRLRALLSSLPFTFMPFAAVWYTQFHKDGFYIFAVYLLFYLFSMRGLSQVSTKRAVAVYLTGSLVAFSLLYVMRRYVFDVFLLQSLFVLLFFAVLCSFRSTQPHRWRSCLCLLLIPLSGLFVKQMTGVGFGNEVSQSYQDRIEEKTKAQQESRAMGGSATRPTELSFLQRLFTKIEYHFETLRLQRQNVTKSWGSTNIDADVRLDSVSDVLLFLPRAAFNTAFALFPSQWFQKGENGFRSMMKKVVMVETLFLYVAYCGLLLFLYRYRFHESQWILLIFCLGMFALLGLVFVNGGTLIRHRYSLAMLLAGWGFAELVILGLKRQKLLSQ